MHIDTYEIISWLAGAAFVLCALPQAVECWRQKHADGVSAGMLWLWLVGEVLFCGYLAKIESWGLATAYFCTACLLSVILYFKYKNPALAVSLLFVPVFVVILPTVAVENVVVWIAVACFVLSGLPQALQCWRQKHAEGLAPGFIWMWFGGAAAAMVYSLHLERLAMILNYVFSLAQVGVIIYFKYRPRPAG